MHKLATVLLVCLLIVPAYKAKADDSNDPFKQFITDNANAIADSIAQPFSKVFSAGITGGMYRGASSHKTLGIDFGIRAMIVMIPSGKSAIFDSSKLKAFPVPMAQISIGLPMNFEVMVRGIGYKAQGANLTLFGASVKKDFKDLIPIPMFPNVAAFIGYHHFKSGYKTFQLDLTGFQGYSGTITADIDATNLISSSHWSYGVVVSRKFGFALFSIEPYAGFSLDHSKLTYKFTTTNTTSNPVIPVGEVFLTEADVTVNTARFTLGADIQPIPFIHVIADYSFMEFPVATLGLAISIR